MIISFLAQKKAYCKHRSRLEYYRLQDEGYARLCGKAVMPGPPRGSDASSLTQQDDLATEAPTQKKGKESTKQKRRKPAKGAEWQPSMAPRIGQQGHCYIVSISTVRIFKDSEDKRSDARNQGRMTVEKSKWPVMLEKAYRQPLGDAGYLPRTQNPKLKNRGFLYHFFSCKNYDPLLALYH